MQNNSSGVKTFSHSLCPNCSSSIIHYNFVSEKSHIYQCTDCGFLFKNPQTIIKITKDEIKNKQISHKTSEEYLNEILGYYGRNKGEFIQIGFGNKELEVSIKEAGLDFTSLEVIGEFEQVVLPTKKFDICVLSNILEYQHSPVNLLEKIHGLMNPGGVLFIVTSSLKNSRDKFSEKYVNYFDSETIQNVLNKTGFNEIYISGDCTTVLSRFRPASKIPKVSIIVPVYNEVKTFSELIKILYNKKINGVEKEIIIVESNSNDGTREAVLEYKNKPGVTVVLEDKPRGKGHAVRKGLSSATGDFVLIQDGDLEYDINDYDQLLVPLIKYQKAFVLGSRHANGFKMRHFETAAITSFVMNIGQVFFVSLLNIFCSQKLKDPFTMYKVFRRDCIYGLTFRANRFDFDFELVIKLLRKGYVPLEIPINYKSRSFSEGKKVRMIRDPLSWIVALFKYRFEKLDMKVYEKSVKINK